VFGELNVSYVIHCHLIDFLFGFVQGPSGVSLRSRKIRLQLLFFVPPHQLILKDIKGASIFMFLSVTLEMHKWLQPN
jgi:hypothetical protein